MLENSDNDYKIVTAVENHNLLEIADEVVLLSWPEFMLHDPVADKYFAHLYETFPEYQFCLIDNINHTVIASGNSIPLYYDGAVEDLPDEGWDWALQKGFDDHLIGASPNMLCALSITIHPAYREKGLSLKMLQIMKKIGRSNKLNGLIAPVRPFQKSVYPLIPIEKYLNWRNENKLPFDAWLRVHEREGGRIIKSCPLSMRISGTVSQWENWTTIRFPESGEYTIYGALVPIIVDCEANCVEYVEPNIWIYHLLDVPFER